MTTRSPSLPTRLLLRTVAALRGSVWWPLFGRAAGLALLFVGLVALGSGALDRLVPGVAHARPETARPAASAEPRTAASAEPVASALAATSASSASAIAAAAPGVLADGRVVLDHATVDELDRLPGIGRKKAEAIVALRAKLGGKFRRLEDLTRIKGIKRKQLERLRPLLVVAPPASDGAPPPASSAGSPPTSSAGSSTASSMGPPTARATSP